MAARRRTGWSRPGTGAMIAQRTPGSVPRRSTRWVPRLGRSRMSGDELAGPHPGGVDDRPGPDRRWSPVQLVGERRRRPGRRRATRTRVWTSAPWAAAVRATASTSRASSSSWPSHDRIPPRRPSRRTTRCQVSVSVDADAARPRQGLARGARGQTQHVAGHGRRLGEAGLGAADRRRQRQHHRQRRAPGAEPCVSIRMPRSTALSWATPSWPRGEVAQAAVHELRAPPAGAVGDVEGVDGDDARGRGWPRRARRRHR